MRYGLLKRIEKKTILPVIDRNRKFISKYYLLNTDFCLDSAPCFDIYNTHHGWYRDLDFIRYNFINDHPHPSEKLSTIQKLDDKGRAHYIRTLMDIEERFITGKNLPYFVLWYYVNNSDEW